jgi:hypothetical protein
MNIKKIIFIAFCCSVVVVFFWSCAGPKEAVKVEEPVKKEVKEPEKEVAKKVEPEVKFKPMEWKAELKDAEVKMGGDVVLIPNEYRDFSLILRGLENNMVEVYLEEKGMKPTLVMECISTLKPDSEGKIAFKVTDMNNEYLDPLFDVIGLRVLDMSELRDSYYLFGSFKERGVSVLNAYDMDSSVAFKFNRM